MPSLKNIPIVIAAFTCLSFSGCALKETAYSPTEADQQFLKIAQDDYHLKPVLKSAGKTLFIYLPQDRDLFLIKANQEEPKDVKKRMSVEYFDGSVKNNLFLFQYDIIPTFQSTKNNGLATAYREDFNKEYQDALGAVSRVYLNSTLPPDFIILVFADIKNGIEIINTLYTQDLKKFRTGVLPYEEYLNRVLTETRGDKKIAGDATGAHIDYQEVQFSNFIVKQIINKINFKYQKSDFTPGEDTEREILKIIQSTFASYQITDFTAVELEDLRNNTHRSYSPALLSSFVE